MPGSRRLLAAKFAEWIALGLVGVVSAIKALGAPTDYPLDSLEVIQRDIVRYYVGIVVLLNAVAISGKLGQWWFNPESKVRMKAVLDALHDSCFQDQPEQERYYNRVTLFKANRRRTKLDAYCRAGDQYQRGIQPFVIHDSDERANEGIAGQAWFRAVTVVVNDLPKVPDKRWDWSSANGACQQYVAAGFLSHQKCSALRVKSRSLLGTPVRDIHGTKWGVLVIDCRHPNAINDQIRGLTESTVRVLGKVL